MNITILIIAIVALFSSLFSLWSNIKIVKEMKIQDQNTLALQKYIQELEQTLMKAIKTDALDKDGKSLKKHYTI